MEYTGVDKSAVPSLSKWSDVWAEHFPDIAIRKFLTVNSKDPVRAWLRAAYREARNRNTQARREVLLRDQILMNSLKSWMGGHALFIFMFIHSKSC